ncbi:MAG: Txe/YoeB family addiction module toxin [Propionibacteriaceae bacterium]|nr:Txe/YoeB family addiction module toxin [Propionibacteriaceae bacterium]
MRVAFTPAGWEDYAYWAATDRKTLLRINKLIEDTLRHPFTGLGKPEGLKHDAHGAWSRRITEEHRLVYTVEASAIVIVQARFHYA